MMFKARNRRKPIPRLQELKKRTNHIRLHMTKGVSISIGEGGKEYFPLTGMIGFAEDRKPLKVKFSMKPGKSYEFIVTSRGFNHKTAIQSKCTRAVDES